MGWEFSCPLNLIGSLPESLTQGLLIGQVLIGGLGVLITILVTNSLESETEARTKESLGLAYNSYILLLAIRLR